jgi:signal transduction histidine kinase
MGVPNRGVLVGVVLLLAVPAFAEGKIRRVLALYPHHRLNPTNIIVGAAVRDRINARGGGDIEFDDENVDITQFNNPLYEEELFRFLKEKYSLKKPDLLFAVTPVSYDFILKRRRDFFPDVPLVGALIPSGNTRTFRPKDKATAVLSSFDHKANLDLVVRLLPHVQNIFVVGGDASPLERSFMGGIKKDFAGDEDRLHIHYLISSPMDELAGTVATLPPHSAVYYYFMAQDRDGRVYIPREVLTELAQVSNAPIFSGVTDAFLGTGVVGGYLVSLKEVGTNSADLMMEILSQRAGDPLPASRTVPVPAVFDGRQLVRWGINEDSLPQNSLVRFRQASIWVLYKGRIIAVGVLFVAELALIVFLMKELKRRKRAEAHLINSQREIQENRAELAHVTRVSTVGELASSLSHEVNQPLAAILSNAQAALRMLKSGSIDFNELGEIFQDIVKDDKRAADVIQRVRSLTKKVAPTEEPVDLNELVTDVLAMVKNDFQTRGVTYALRLDPNLPLVKGDPIQLQQVVLNLLLNGFDALAEKPVDQRRLTFQTGTNPSNGVRLSLGDSGDGIPADKIKTIFEAFYTTKPQGMGLGLSICASIVKAHRGLLTVENQPEGGAVFHVTLPALHS